MLMKDLSYIKMRIVLFYQLIQSILTSRDRGAPTNVKIVVFPAASDCNKNLRK